MFNIEVKSSNIKIIETEPYADCLLSLEDDFENILIPISYWSFEDYQRHWLSNLEDFSKNNMASTLLLIEMYELEKANFLKGLALYRQGVKIIIQEQIVFLDELESEFLPEESFKALSEYASISEDGYDISEWMISEEDMQDFAHKIKSKFALVE